MQHVFNGGRNVLNEGGDYHVQLETACSDVGLQGLQRQPLEWMKKLLFLSHDHNEQLETCLLYTSPSPRDLIESRMPSSA